MNEVSQRVYNFTELIDIIKNKLLENNGNLLSILKKIKELKSDFKINYGRLNSLFPDPNILPGGSLKYLAYNIFEHKKDMYQYSSYEKTFGRPVGNLVRFKNLNSGKYLYPKKGSFELGTPLTQLNYQEAEKNIFRLIPSGEDDSFFIVSEYEKKSFDVKSGLDVNGTPLTLWNSHFSDNQRFRFEKEYSSTTNEAVVRIVSTKTNKSLDVQFNSKSNNAVVHFWDWYDLDSQKWIIETVK